MNETRQFRDGQHRKMWRRIRGIRREAAGRGDYFVADFMELLELIASGERIGKVTVCLKNMPKPAIESIILSTR